MAAAGPLACKQGAKSLCKSDSQCAPGFACNPATGACGCQGDSSCASAESCNAAGFCQPRLRCASSADCDGQSICDAPSGTCIPSGTCTIDVQCKQGEVCDNFSCVKGCRLSGDCAVSEVCRPCPAGTPAQDCPVQKQCVAGHCDSQLSCRYGEICAPGSDDPSDTVCSKDQRGPFCEPCVLRPGTPEYCPGGNANYCLIDASVVLGQAFFCGVDCSLGQECPNGYVCHDVRIVTAQNCDPKQGISACPARPNNTICDPGKTHPRGGGLPGVVNDDCEAASPPLVGAVCDPGAHRCAAECLGTGEAGIQAFCSCIQDSDCPEDFCESATHACSISGKPCIVGSNPDECQSTHRIFCVKASDPQLGEVGYCRIGQNCAPGEGFSCSVLRSGH